MPSANPPLDAEPMIYCHRGSSDVLKFIPDPNYRVVTDTESWIAMWDGWRDHESAFHTRDGYYRVWEKKGDGWDVSRPDHPIAGNQVSKFRYKTRDYAMRACAEDFVVVARLWRWQQHMKTYEPPEAP